MKKFIIISALAVFSLSAFAQKTSDHKTDAVTVLNELNSKEYAKVHSQFDSTIASKMDVVKLGQIWDGLITQVGAFKSSAAPTSSSIKNIVMVDQLCEFEKTSLVFRVGFDSKNKICTFVFLPPPPKENYKEPSYAKKESMSEQEIVVKSGNFELPGTFTFPKNEKKFPVIILVHG